jgi:flagellar basal body-associated protein FliL
MTTTPPTGNPAEPTRPTPMTPTQPTPAAPGPPPGPPAGPPTSSGGGATPPPSPSAAPSKKGGGLLLVGFIAATVLFIVALVFAIFSFVGKNDESDKKDKAQKELASTKKELAQTKGELGTSEAASGLLGDLVNAGDTAAKDLKACTDSARQLRSNIVAALNEVQANRSIEPLVDGINAQITENNTTCNASDDSYQQFADALSRLQSGRR